MRDPRSGRPLSRRDLLAGSAALAAGAVLSPWANALAPLPRLAKTRRVIFVVLGGGVRTRETLESENTPNLRRMADEGKVYPNVRVQNLGHYGATVSLLTGSWEVFGIREYARPNMPTVFEQVRKSTGLPASQVWLSTSGSDQETNYAYSGHGSYGSRYGANLIGGEGIFNAEFKELVTGDGEQRLMRPDAETQAALGAMRGAVDTPLPVSGGSGVGNDPESAARIEDYILDELSGGAAAITGLGANDAKAMHVGRNLLGIFQPRLMAVTLRDADVAHGSYNDYVNVIRRNDAELGQLMDTIRGDATLADSTSVIVMPEFGRDRDFNARRGLDHGDDSDELHKVALVAWGPDITSKGKVERKEIRAIDVAPTLVDVFGGKPGPRTGSIVRGLLG